MTRRTALYSNSRSRRPAQPPRAAETAAAATPAAAPAVEQRPGRLRAWAARHPQLVSTLFSALVAGAVALAVTLPNRQGAPQAAAEEAEEKLPMATEAYEAIRTAVVRVRGFGPEMKDKDATRGDAEEPYNVGTGVVILDNGTILTNLHVVNGASRVKVTFHDGLESDAVVIGTRPEDDLAVLRAQTIPDDLIAATMRSTADLAPGDPVVAVGFPFGIGPSVSAGVVSGLNREYHSPQGKRLLTNLIQFDAAANPGNSGGPLVTAGGEVVGIVTGILNPTEQRVSIGIGFAVPIENAAMAVGLPPF
jgi:S1-C subfamily serine protease